MLMPVTNRMLRKIFKNENGSSRLQLFDIFHQGTGMTNRLGLQWNFKVRLLLCYLNFFTEVTWENTHFSLIITYILLVDQTLFLEPGDLISLPVIIVLMVKWMGHWQSSQTNSAFIPSFSIYKCGFWMAEKISYIF